MREAQRTKDDDDELFNYKRRKQDLRIEDLKRFGIQTLLVDEYSDITKILREIEARYRKRTVFFSGSAEESRSEEHTSELQSLLRIPHDVFCMKKTTITLRCA